LSSTAEKILLSLITIGYQISPSAGTAVPVDAMPKVSATSLKQMPALFSGRHYSSLPVLPTKGGHG